MSHQKSFPYAPPSLWSSVEVAPRAILVATALDEPSAVALRRAHHMAEKLDATLFVLHVIPPVSRLGRILSRVRGARPGSRAPSDDIAIGVAAGAARRWCDWVLGPAAQPPVLVERGPVAKTVARVATHHAASLVVLGDACPAKRGRLPRTSARVIEGVLREAPCPVLVARAERSTTQIVAATNSTDRRYPALCQAARLGARLGAQVTFMHNVDRSDQVIAASFLGVSVPVVVPPLDSDLQRSRAALEDAARFVGEAIETVVTANVESSEAILEVARRRDADLVVVGIRERRPLRRRSLGTTAKVARRAKRSVLAVPLRLERPRVESTLPQLPWAAP